MTSVPTAPGKRRPTDQEAISLELVSGVLMIIGFIAFGYLFYTVVNNDDIVEATQGPEVEGIGVDISRVEPEPSVLSEPHFALDVSSDSVASELGLQDGDVLVKVGDSTINGAEMDEEALQAALATAFNSAAADGEENVSIDVYRRGEEISVFIPLPDYEYLFELRVPTPDTETLGLEIESAPAQPLTPYYEMDPTPGGPADQSGVQRGDRLIRVEDVEITPELPLAYVRSLIAEEDIDRSEDDFEILIEFLREEENGDLIAQERNVPKNVAPTLIIAYLDNFGFVIPFLTLFVGWMLIRLGARLRKYDLIAARWSIIAFLWIIVGLFVAGFRMFWVEAKGGIVTDQPFNFGDGIVGALPYLLATAPLIAAMLWLGSAIKLIFVGEETLSSSSTRFAWSLLIPTLAVLVMVAARPLEQTVLTSFTDDEFGTNRPARFIGLDNYQQLLSFRFTTVECQKDDNDECARTTTGKQAIIWERSDFEEEQRDEFREKLPTLSDKERETFFYKEAYTWRLFGSETGLRLLGKDPIFLRSVGNTLQFTLLSVTLELILGLIIALVVNSNFSGRGLMRTAMLVPWAIPTVIAAVLWQAMLRPDQTGIFNVVLQDLRVLDEPEQWLAATGPWMNTIIAIDVWKTAPFMALLLLAGLQTIPADLYEAAAVDGASRVRQFFSITLPLLRPTIAIALIFRTLDSLRVFDVFQVLLGADRPSMAMYNYDRLVLGRLDGYSSAVGVIIFIMILIFTVGYVRFVGIESEG